MTKVIVVILHILLLKDFFTEARFGFRKSKEILAKQYYAPVPPPTAAPVPVPAPTPPRPNPIRTCECVPSYLCDEGNIITDGGGIIEPRQSQPTCSSNMVCCTAPNEAVARSSLKMAQDCGKSKMVDSSTSQKSAGLTAEGEVPWQVAILRVTDEVEFFVGGGILIHPKIVITAAHVVKDTPENLLMARLGEWNFGSESESNSHFDIKVKEIIIRRDFSIRSLANDLAILILVNNAPDLPNVGLACLPPHPTFNAAGMTCYVSGWGKNATGVKGQYSITLRKILVNVISNEDCQVKLRETKLGPYFTLDASFICATGMESTDACQGDGGGPMMCLVAERQVIAGIVAWGLGCGSTVPMPGAYVNVARFVSWIQSRTSSI